VGLHRRPSTRPHAAVRESPAVSPAIRARPPETV